MDKSWTNHSSKKFVIFFHCSRILSTPSNHPKHYTCNETIKNMPKFLWTRLYFTTSIFLGCLKTCLKNDPWSNLILSSTCKIHDWASKKDILIIVFLFQFLPLQFHLLFQVWNIGPLTSMEHHNLILNHTCFFTSLPHCVIILRCKFPQSFERLNNHTKLLIYFSCLFLTLRSGTLLNLLTYAKTWKPWLGQFTIIVQTLSCNHMQHTSMPCMQL
jgi:hypothetical protein